MMHFAPGGSLSRALPDTALIPERRRPNEARTRPSTSLPILPLASGLVLTPCLTIPTWYYSLQVNIQNFTMSLQWTRAGPLRHLRLGATFSPTRVIAVQNQLRNLSLSAEPRSKTPQAGSFSAFVSQSRALSTQTATETESAKPKRGRPLGSTKAAGPNGRSPKKLAVKAKKPKKQLTDKQKADKEKRARSAQIKELKVLSLNPPAKLTASAWPLGVKEMYESVNSGAGTSQEKLTEAITKLKALSPEEYKVRFFIIPLWNNY